MQNGRLGLHAAVWQHGLKSVTAGLFHSNCLMDRNIIFLQGHLVMRYTIDTGVCV